MTTINRPRKLTIETQERITNGIRNGLSLSKSALLSGVSEKTIYHWLSEAKKEESCQELKEFSEAIDQAKQDRMNNLRENILGEK